MLNFIKSTTLMLVLLNPFLIIIYLTDMVQNLDQKQFTSVMLRAGSIASLVFFCFAILGDAIFEGFLQAEFASFQIFGGIIFLLIGLQFVFRGPSAIEILQGRSKHLAGAVAMPVLIGPGTISASVVIGKKHTPLIACASVLIAVLCCIISIIVLKKIHDMVLPRREELVHRYIEIAGRVTALIVGTIAIDMIMRGIRIWVEKF